MEKGERTGSPNLTLLAILLSLLSAASCAPMLAGEAAYQGAVVTVAAASSASTEEHDKHLKRSVSAFNDAFRFEDYLQASVFISPDKKENFWSEADRFKGKIRIADYELRDVQVDEKNNYAIAILNLQYWRPESPALKTVSCTQKWEYSKKDKAWTVSHSGFEVIPSNTH